jgi:aspartate/methionine/tyrosine aminotransferase
MQGSRLGFAAGNAEVVANLTKIKSNMDFGVFMAIQRAGLAVLDGPQDYCADAARCTARAARRSSTPSPPPTRRSNCRGRRSTCGCRSRRASRTRSTSPPTCSIGPASVVSPGSGFGNAGEGYVRIALCVDEARMREAGRRIVEAGYRW